MSKFIGRSANGKGIVALTRAEWINISPRRKAAAKAAKEWIERVKAAKVARRANERAAALAALKDKTDRWETFAEFEASQRRAFDWIESESDDRFSRVSVPVWITRIAPSGNAAIMLAQICFWHGRSKNESQPIATKVVDGKRWWVMGYDLIAKRTGLTENKVRAALDTLEAEGLIMRRVLPDVHKRAPTSHLRPNYQGMARAYLKAYPPRPGDDYMAMTTAVG